MEDVPKTGVWACQQPGDHRLKAQFRVECWVSMPQEGHYDHPQACSNRAVPYHMSYCLCIGETTEATVHDGNPTLHVKDGEGVCSDEPVKAPLVFGDIPLPQVLPKAARPREHECSRAEAKGVGPPEIARDLAATKQALHKAGRGRENVPQVTIGETVERHKFSQCRDHSVHGGVQIHAFSRSKEAERRHTPFRVRAGPRLDRYHSGTVKGVPSKGRQSRLRIRAEVALCAYTKDAYSYKATWASNARVHNGTDVYPATL